MEYIDPKVERIARKMCEWIDGMDADNLVHPDRQPMLTRTGRIIVHPQTLCPLWYSYIGITKEILKLIDE